MNNEDTINTNSTIDSTLLLVSGSKGGKLEDKEYRKKLSNAILQVFHKHNKVTLRAVGAAAISNAMMAWTIADIEALKQGVLFAGFSVFANVDFNGDTKTGMVIEILPLDEFVKARKKSLSDVYVPVPKKEVVD